MRPPFTDDPVTVARLVIDLRRLGLAPGDVVLVHSSLKAVSGARSIVIGGAVAVIDALSEVLGPEGTLVMTAQSTDNSEPSRWRNPPVPESWWPIIRAHQPAYGPDRTPSRGVGVVPETFRAMHDVVRGEHPLSSFAARGPRASEIVLGHTLEADLGDDGPLGHLYRLDARVLLIGAGFDACTAFHLAEHRMSRPPRTVKEGAAILRDGQRAWVEFLTLEYDADDFADLGRAFEQEEGVRTGPVGRARSRLFSMRSAVDFASRWLDQNRV
jgi:aminoglycoside 3-N-acetyltransferase